MRRAALVLSALALTAFVAACGGGSKPTELPRGSAAVKLDPREFTTLIDNPYWPMRPGSRWVYRETDSKGNRQRVVVTVTPRTKRILGIEARVVHDVATEDGQLVEDTYDWVAQDRQGNIWYLGEATKEYENGQVKTTAGSWEAGIDGAQPGVLLPASPEPGTSYRQEYYEGKAEDAAEVLSVDEKASVPYGSFDHVLMTRDTTPLEPALVEHKLYARGVGPVLTITVSGGSSRGELLRFDRPS